MGSIFTISILQSALELGCIYALVALALFVSFSILNIADLSTDGCFTLGCAVCAMVTIQGHPILALAAAMLAGVCSGFITAFLQTKLGIESILAGIIVNTGLYTINIAVMGFASQVNLFNCNTIFTMAKNAIGGGWYKLIVAALIVLVIGVILSAFLNTRLGLSIRATGDNADMVKASSINPSFTITVGLCVANAMTALSGGVLAQYQKYQPWNRYGNHCTCQPDYRRIHYRKRLHVPQSIRRCIRKLSLSFLSSRCIKTECSGRGIETGFCNYRSNCNCIPVLKEEGSVCQTEERSTEEIKRQYASGGSKYKGNGR